MKKQILNYSFLLLTLVYSCKSPDLVESSDLDFTLKSSLRVTPKGHFDLMKKNLSNINQVENIEVKEGVFQFKSPEIFLDFLKSFDIEKENFDKKFNSEFSAKRLRLDNIKKKIESLSSQEDLLKFVDANKDYIYIEDSTIHLLNRNNYDFLFTEPSKNYIFIGNIIYLFEKDATYLILDGDRAKIGRCKKREENIENVIVDMNPSSISKNAKVSETIPISNLEISGRQYNPSDAGKRGTAGVDFNRTFVLFSTNTGQPLYTITWGMRTQGYPERRTLGIWFNVNSNLTLTPNYITKGFLNGTQISSNQNMPKPKQMLSGYNSELNDFEYMYGETAQGGTLTITEAQKSQVTQTITSNGGFFTTGQVPNININY